MDANGRQLILKDEVFQVIGAAMEVLNLLGHGLLEKSYENALAVELRVRGIPFTQQPRFPLFYKDVQIGEFVPDLIVHEQVVVEAKIVEKITDHERGQILNYLKITGLPVGLIVNFRRATLEWERLVRSTTANGRE